MRRLLLLLAIACAASSAASASTPRDLAGDEAAGGHTLARHVALSDSQLRGRLERERGITAASTWTDRRVAEEIVGQALADSAERVARWTARYGRRPNLALRYRGSPARPIGRSLERGAAEPRACCDAVIVLRWNERRGDYFVLTSYPEARR